MHRCTRVMSGHGQAQVLQSPRLQGRENKENKGREEMVVAREVRTYKVTKLECDEQGVLDATEELFNSKFETNNGLYVGELNLNFKKMLPNWIVAQTECHQRPESPRAALNSFTSSRCSIL